MAYRSVNSAEQIQIQVRLPLTVRERLQKEADRRTVSVNYLVERALTDSLDRWEKQKL